MNDQQGPREKNPNSRKGSSNGNHRHGMHGTKEYRAWESMKTRCTNPNNSQYKNYGGRGIVVCGRWAKSFEKFLKDMGPAPSPKHSLDRINSDGPYSPKNCRWATVLEQARNKRGLSQFKFNGRMMCLSEVAAETGILYTRLQDRIYRQGLTIEQATTLPHRYGRKAKIVSLEKYNELYETCEKLRETIGMVDSVGVPEPYDRIVREAVEAFNAFKRGINNE